MRARLQFLFVLAALVLAAAPASGQAIFLGPDATGLSVNVSYASNTDRDVDLLGVEAVGTLTPRVDLAVSYTSAQPFESYRRGWAAVVTGTVYPLAGPHARVGLVGGLTRVGGYALGGTAIVYGVGAAGRAEAGPVALVPQASVVAVSKLDGRLAEDRSVALGLGLGVEIPTARLPLVIEPAVSFAFGEELTNSEGALRYDTVVGLTLRVVRAWGD